MINNMHCCRCLFAWGADKPS